MKDLPKLYKNNNIKPINNNKTNCILNNIDEKNIEKTISNIFNDRGFPYNKRVIIKTKDKTYNTNIIMRKNNTIYTLDNDSINIKDILSIERVK